MERKDELTGRQAATHLRRREERGKLDSDRLPAGAQQIDHQSPSGRHLGKRLPVLGLSRRTGAMGMTSLGHVASPSGCREERGGEAGAQSGVLDDDPGEFRMALEKPGPAGDGERLMVGRKHQTFHDYNLALARFLEQNPELAPGLRRLALRRAAGRAAKWARREGGQRLPLRYLALDLAARIGFPLDHASAIRSTLPAFALGPAASARPLIVPSMGLT